MGAVIIHGLNGEHGTERSIGVSDELHYRLLVFLQERPEASQREIAQHIGVSLGKTNYCLHALIDKGWVKAGNFYRNRNKLAYAYLLTPQGVDAKLRITRRFLQRKLSEHAALSAEIEQLRQELGEKPGAPHPSTPDDTGVPDTDY